jgi:hypothetical protein
MSSENVAAFEHMDEDRRAYQDQEENIVKLGNSTRGNKVDTIPSDVELERGWSMPRDGCHGLSSSINLSTLRQAVLKI